MFFFLESEKCVIPTYEYKCNNCGVVEIFHGMSEDNKTKCPECNVDGLVKLVSAGGGVIIGGREANQYSDIHAAKYWRDKNGNRHPVTAADGYSTSSTVDRQTVTPAEAKAKTKRDRKAERKKRINLTSARAKNWNREQVKKADSWGSGHVAEES